MSGTVIGGMKAAEANLARDPQFYCKIGAIGGRNGHTGGFYANRDLARVAGTIGGSISRRGKDKLSEKRRREIRRAYEELLEVHTKAKRERRSYTYA